jgi:chromate transporter
LGRLEWPAAVIGIAAAIALIRFKVGVIPVVFVSGLCGLALSFAPYLVTS